MFHLRSNFPPPELRPSSASSAYCSAFLCRLEECVCVRSNREAGILVPIYPPSYSTIFILRTLFVVPMEVSESYTINEPKKLVESPDEVNDSPIEQVRLTVPTTDDPSLPCLTFRTWALGITSCAILAFLNQFFGYRQNALYISSVSAQILVLPVGKLMAAYLPCKQFRILLV